MYFCCAVLQAQLHREFAVLQGAHLNLWLTVRVKSRGCKVYLAHVQLQTAVSKKKKKLKRGASDGTNSHRCNRLIQHVVPFLFISTVFFFSK